MQALPPLGPLHGGFVLSGIGVKEIARTQLLEENRLLLTKNKTNKNHPVGEKQTAWLAGKAGLDKAGQGRTQTTSNIR